MSTKVHLFCRRHYNSIDRTILIHFVEHIFIHSVGQVSNNFYFVDDILIDLINHIILNFVEQIGLICSKKIQFNFVEQFSTHFVAQVCLILSNTCYGCSNIIHFMLVSRSLHLRRCNKVCKWSTLQRAGRSSMYREFIKDIE